MRILIDECVPERLAKSLLPHAISTVANMGWAGKKNGELLRLMAEEKFEAFITVDQNLQYQQNLRDTRIAVIVLSAASNRYSDLLTLIPSIHSILTTAESGKIYTIKK